MDKDPRHRPHRVYPDAPRIILAPEIQTCPACGQKLTSRQNWHTRKTIQTLQGPLFVAGKSAECQNSTCPKQGKRYYASRAWLYSLPFSSYGLDVLAFIGWQHEHHHQQLLEIHRALKQRGIEINERNVGKLYRQFLALLGASQETVREKLTATAREHGGLIWALDGLKPEGSSAILYVLSEVFSNQPVAALQGEGLDTQALKAWLEPYRKLDLPVLATLSDGEKILIDTLKTSWPEAPHQRCQLHFLNNLAADLQEEDDRLRKDLPTDLGGLPPVPPDPDFSP